MSHVHFVGGEKGGVGKSVVARLLAQRFVDREVAFAAIDADVSHGSLRRYYAEYTQAIDLAEPESVDRIMDRALGAERRVLVDLPAQSGRALATWMTEANVLSFAKEAGIRMTFWHVTDGGFDSVDELAKTLARFGSDVSHVVVKNYGRSKDFQQLDESDAKKRLDELGGQVLELAALDPSVMYKIDRLGSSFWAAIHTAEGAFALKPLERERAKLWLQKSYAAFDGAAS